MRSLLAIALILTACVASLWVWGAVHAHRMTGSSSQIFVHGTPVCVTQRGGQIEAAVGECDGVSANPHGGYKGYHGENSAPGNPHVDLPPGHPPIGDDPSPGYEAKRRLLI